MISQEFEAAVSSKNLLRVRIMLKDSFMLDPTLDQLNEMLSYAKKYLPDLFVPFDGGKFENDQKKWNIQIMNEELVQLISNFSEIRLKHLRDVVTKVFQTEIVKEQHKKSGNIDRPFISSDTKRRNRQKALNIIENNCDEIQCIKKRVNERGGWNSKDIKDVRRAALNILNGIKAYKNNE